MGNPGLGAELAGSWWWLCSCSGNSVSSQRGCFPISISAVLDFWLFWVTGRAPASGTMQARQCRTSGWREGRSRPELEGVPGSGATPSWLSGPARLFIPLSLHFLIGKMRALLSAPAPRKCPDPVGLFVHDLI